MIKRRRKRRLTSPKPESLPTVTTSREYEALSEAQREALSQFYDKPIRKSDIRPMTSAERKRWSRVKKHMARPNVAAGSKMISLRVETNLLARADAHAERAGLNRSELVAIGLKLAIAADARGPRQ